MSTSVLRAICAAGVAAFVVGCAPSGPTNTVEYYKAHPDERKATLRACGNNPGEKAAEPNCVNASQAEALSVLGSSR